MSKHPDCPTCGKNDKVVFQGRNRVANTASWYCLRCRTPFKSGGGIKG